MRITFQYTGAPCAEPAQWAGQITMQVATGLRPGFGSLFRLYGRNFSRHWHHARLQRTDAVHLGLRQSATIVET